MLPMMRIAGVISHTIGHDGPSSELVELVDGGHRRCSDDEADCNEQGRESDHASPAFARGL